MRVKKPSRDKQDIIVLIGIITTLIISSWIYLCILKNDINIVYNGIKYQYGNIGYEEVVEVKVEGEYITGLFGFPDKFSGKIVIDDMEGNFKLDTFNINKMIITEIKEKYSQNSGLLYLNETLNNLTVDIYEFDQNGDRNFSNDKGWFISAPCKTREEAVEISNNMINRSGFNVSIK